MFFAPRTVDGVLADFHRTVDRLRAISDSEAERFVEKHRMAADLTK